MSKNLELIRKESADMPLILAVELIDDYFSNEWIHSLERLGVCELDVGDILRINPWIKKVDIIDFDLTKGKYKVYHHIGNNQRLLHYPKGLKTFKTLSIEELNKVQKLLQEGKIEEAIIHYFPYLDDMKDCFQLDPKHIDDVFVHTKKGLDSLNQIIEKFSFIYKPTEEEIFLMQLSMLFHDAGKPYTTYGNQVSRYTQFSHHYENIGKYIIEQVFRNYHNQDLLKYLASFSIVNGKRQYHHFFSDLRETISEEEIEASIWMMFLTKVAHIMTLKPQKFSGYYQECLKYLHDFLFYNSRTWRNDNEKNQIITPALLAHLPSLEGELQPYYQIDAKEEVVNLSPILLELLNTDFNEFYDHDFLSKRKDYSSLLPQYQLKEAVAMLKSSSIFSLFQEELSGIRMEAILKSKIHGVYHNEKVAFLVVLIALNEGCSMKEISLLLKAAIYHDCGRVNDHDEARHGVLGVYRFRKMFQNSISSEDMRIISFMIEAHAIADSSIKELLEKYQVTESEQPQFLKLASILKDADGLDRIRISMDLPYSKLNPNYLRTETALKLIRVSHELNECYQKQNFYKGSLLKRKLYKKN